jgi:RNA polymerase sigma-70 factor (ECF subfamily)
MNAGARSTAGLPSAGAQHAAERAARSAYGRLLALLASRSRDIAAAEDALADAFVAALTRWPVDGVPANPDAWLFTAARRTIGHARARGVTAAAGEAALALLAAEREAAETLPFADERLKLLFVCAHPAIAADAQAPLMLQTVLGLDAARIAASFLVTPAAMGQRLVRAKSRIRDAGIVFVIPDPAHVGDRLGAVRAAIYAAYGTGWDHVAGTDARTLALAPEAIWLARLLLALSPDDAENQGLLALMLFCEARRGARRDDDGGFVPLRSQDPHRWDAAALAEAEALLRAAARFGTPGRFQVEAAIQSLHAETVLTGHANPGPLLALYDLLLAIAPSIGAQVARAAVLADAGDPDAALDALDAVADRATRYQPWWAARALALHRAGNDAAAHDAAIRAAGLASDPAARRFLLDGRLFDVAPVLDERGRA